jgi:hypothetical protein
MTYFDFLVLLLPVVFMLHDFEEIILFRRFLKKNGANIAATFPRLKAIIVRANTITVSAFTLVVAEEFLIISAISFSAVYFSYYYVWIAAFMAFFLHFLIHIIQCLVFRRYTPGLVTSLIFTPACIYVFKRLLIETSYTYLQIAALSAAGIAIMIINLGAMHYLTGKLKI